MEQSRAISVGASTGLYYNHTDFDFIANELDEGVARNGEYAAIRPYTTGVLEEGPWQDFDVAYCIHRLLFALQGLASRFQCWRSLWGRLADVIDDF